MNFSFVFVRSDLIGHQLIVLALGVRDNFSDEVNILFSAFDENDGLQEFNASLDNQVLAHSLVSLIVGKGDLILKFLKSLLNELLHELISDVHELHSGLVDEVRSLDVDLSCDVSKLCLSISIDSLLSFQHNLLLFFLEESLSLNSDLKGLLVGFLSHYSLQLEAVRIQSAEG